MAINFYQAAALLISVAGLMAGLIRYHFSLKDKYEETKSALTNQTIKALHDAVSGLGARLTDLERGLQGAVSDLAKRIEERINFLNERFHALQKECVEMQSELKSTREHSSRKFAAEIKEIIQSELKYLGEGAWRVSERKGGGK